DVLNITEVSELENAGSYYSNKLTDVADKIDKEECANKIFRIYERIIELISDTDLVNKNRISEKCGSYSYTLIQNELFDISLQFAQFSIKINPDIKITYSNLPLCYIFNNQWQKAKQIYLERKDIHYNEEQTFREIFLEDIDNLENECITHPDFSKVRELLKEEKTNADSLK
ncbi:MAG: hypothetical protein HY738_06165, partial [Bacteroidia bacterium]|nr:hypothetical protein [Bacteroidia bacterium]